MKTNYYFLFILFGFLISYSANAQCDSCGIAANFIVQNNGPCQPLGIYNITTSDSCTSYTHYIVDYGFGGMTDTSGSSNPIINDIYSYPDTFIMCLYVFGQFQDSSGIVTCSDTICKQVIKEPCVRRLKAEQTNVEWVEFYPNPVSSYLTIKLNQEVDRVTILTIEGKEVYHVQNGKYSQLNVDVSGWEKGIYLIRSTKGEEVQLKKLLVQ